MTEIGVSADFFPAYASLPRKAQRKVETFLQKFRQDPKQASIHYEPIVATADARLRSVRIGDDYRAIVRAPEGGELFLLLWVDHHDEAYRWGGRKGPGRVAAISEAGEAAGSVDRVRPREGVYRQEGWHRSCRRPMAGNRGRASNRGS
jgi:mRNA-degrading endonuclease RelE of RelBE toxin-antitoxin system